MIPTRHNADLFNVSTSECRTIEQIYLQENCPGCLLSETYGRNGATPIFKYFHRTASFTSGGWSRWNILMCFF